MTFEIHGKVDGSVLTVRVKTSNGEERTYTAVRQNYGVQIRGVGNKVLADHGEFVAAMAETFLPDDEELEPIEGLEPQ